MYHLSRSLHSAERCRLYSFARSEFVKLQLYITCKHVTRGYHTTAIISACVDEKERRFYNDLTISNDVIRLSHIIACSRFITAALDTDKDWRRFVFGRFISRRVCGSDVVATERLNSLFAESRSQLNSEVTTAIQLNRGRDKRTLVKHKQSVTACRNSATTVSPECAALAQQCHTLSSQCRDFDLHFI